MVEGRDFKHWTLVLEAFDKVFDQGFTLFSRYHVELVEHHPARFVEQGCIVFFQLPHNGLGLRHRVNAIIKRGHVHHVQQQPGALQMAQKQMAQACAFGRTLNQTWQIGHHKALLRAHTHHTQVGVQGGEGVIGNAWAGVGDGGDQRGLARIGQAEQADIGQNFEL